MFVQVLVFLFPVLKHFLQLYTRYVLLGFFGKIFDSANDTASNVLHNMMLLICQAWITKNFLITIFLESVLCRGHILQHEVIFVINKKICSKL